MKMEQTECYETSAYKIQKPANYPEESIERSMFFFMINPQSSSKYALIRLENLAFWTVKGNQLYWK